MDFIKIKNVCAWKDTISRLKSQPTGWDKIFTNHIPDKGLTSRLYKELLRIHNNKTKQSSST